MPLRLLLVALSLTAGLSARNRIAYIEFFGYRGLDVEAARRALPFHEGDPISKWIRPQAEAAVRKVIGRELTDVAMICCVGSGDTAVFIGLPGESARTLAYETQPLGDAPPSPQLSALFRKMEAAEEAAMKKGIFGEDGKPGYRIMKDPRAAAPRAARLPLTRSVTARARSGRLPRWSAPPTTRTMTCATTRRARSARFSAPIPLLPFRPSRSASSCAPAFGAIGIRPHSC